MTAPATPDPAREALARVRRAKAKLTRANAKAAEASAELDAEFRAAAAVPGVTKQSIIDAAGVARQTVYDALNAVGADMRPPGDTAES